MIYIYHSNYFRLFVTSSSHVLDNFQIPRRKTGYLLERFTNGPSSWLLHKIGTAGQTVHAPWNETNNIPREQRLENMSSDVILLILTYPCMSWQILQHGHVLSGCKTTLSPLSCVASDSVSTLGSDISAVFQLASTAHNTLRRSGLTKCREWPLCHDCSAWPSQWMNAQGCTIIICALIFLNEPCSIPTHSSIQKSMHLRLLKQPWKPDKSRSTSLGSICLGPRVFVSESCQSLGSFERAYCVIPSDGANSFRLGRESP